MAEREHVLVREFADSLYGKDAHIFITPMIPQRTRGSPRSRLHGFGWGSFKNATNQGFQCRDVDGLDQPNGGRYAVKKKSYLIILFY